MAERAPPAEPLRPADRGGRPDEELLAARLDSDVWVVPPGQAAGGGPRFATLLQPGGDALTVLIGVDPHRLGGRSALPSDGAVLAAHARELAATRAAIRRAVRRVRRLAWLPRLALLPVVGGVPGSGVGIAGSGAACPGRPRRCSPGPRAG